MRPNEDLFFQMAVSSFGRSANLKGYLPLHTPLSSQAIRALTLQPSTTTKIGTHQAKACQGGGVKTRVTRCLTSFVCEKVCEKVWE